MAARPLPGFEEREHRFGFGLGYAAAVSSGVAAALGRLDYTFGWQGWGLGAVVAFSLGEIDVVSDTSDDLGFVGLVLRRNMLLGNLRLWAGAELGIVRLSRGEVGDAEVVLYHGTSSAFELGAELGRTATMRPFVSVRADLPWNGTEFETLKPAPPGSPESGAILVDDWQRWTPVLGVWGGIAL